MTTSSLRAFSDLPIPPGEVLEEELAARGMTQKELAARLGRPPQVVNEIIKAKKAITPETALELEKVLGIDAQFWVNLEAGYRMTLAKNKDQDEIAGSVDSLADFPIQDMVKRRWIPADLDKPARLRALLNFLGVAEPQAFQEAVGFRMTQAALRRVSLGALAVWLRKGELDAQGVETNEYHEHAFIAALIEIRAMTGKHPEDFIPAIKHLCSGAGVVFLMIREFPKSGANGATRWLTHHKALIQMSIRNKWADIFWFSFFHEAGHLLKHRSRRVFIEGIDKDPDLVTIESEADEFARDFLIPAVEWETYVSDGYFTAASIQEFSTRIQIAPFMVVGRLQREKRLDYNQMTGMKRRYQWVNKG